MNGLEEERVKSRDGLKTDIEVHIITRRPPGNHYFLGEGEKRDRPTGAVILLLTL